MKRSTAIKAIFSVLCSVCMILFIASAYFFVRVLGSKGFQVSEKGEHSALYMHRVEAIADWREREIIIDYQNSLQAVYSGGDIQEEMEALSEKYSIVKSNVAFCITPSNKKLPVVKNYETEDYIYHKQERNLMASVFGDSMLMEYNVSPENILAGWRNLSPEELYRLREKGQSFLAYEPMNVIASEYREDFAPVETTVEESWDDEDSDDWNEEYLVTEWNDEEPTTAEESYESYYEYSYPALDESVLPMASLNELRKYGGCYTVMGYVPQDIRDAYGDWKNVTLWDFELEIYPWCDNAKHGDGICPVLHLRKTDYRFDLRDDAEFANQWKGTVAQCAKEGGPLSGLEFEYADYDWHTGDLVMSLSAFYGQFYDLELFVRSDFSAPDDFSHSLLLKYADAISRGTFPCMVITAVLFLAFFVFLLVCAGYRAPERDFYLNWFDRIPLEVFAVFFVGVFFLLDRMSIWNFAGYWEWAVLCVPIGVGALLFPPCCMTVVSRYRVDGFGFFKRTLTWQIIALALRWIKKLLGFLGRALLFLGKKVATGVKNFTGHLNLYWRWLGAFTVLAVLEGIFVLSDVEEMSLLFGFAVYVLVSFFLVSNIMRLYRLKEDTEKIAKGDTEGKIDTESLPEPFRSHGENINNIGAGIQLAVEEKMKSERMKTELITNMSHDIKTPLTSIVSYVDLLSKEDDLSDKEREYVEVLTRQSARLKKLIEDLLEASKASTGNLEVHLAPVDAQTLVEQAVGEFAERLEEKKLKVLTNNQLGTAKVMADGGHLWRVFENLIGNVVKYAQAESRVYIDIDKKGGKIQIVFKNVSAQELNISGDELMERFVRGDKSRNTEGSGLGLSIAKSLMELMGGSMEILIDGDLFKVVLELSEA